MINKTQPQRLLESIIPNKADKRPEVMGKHRDADCYHADICPLAVREVPKWSVASIYLTDSPKKHQSERILPTRRNDPNENWAMYNPDRATPNKAVQVCNAGDWPTVEDQQRFWQERDEHLDRTESNALWFDNKAKTDKHPFA